MQEVAVFGLGLVVGIGLTLLVGWARRGTVTDLSGPATRAVRADAGPSATSDPGFEPAAGSVVDPSLAGRDFLASLPKGAHVTRTTITRRIQTKVGPGGSLSIVVDGTPYAHLDEIADAAIRDEVRTILRSVPAAVSDPANRDTVEEELREAGVDAGVEPGAKPDPPPGASS